jgi:hypothetical protein
MAEIVLVGDVSGTDDIRSVADAAVLTSVLTGRR